MIRGSSYGAQIDVIFRNEISRLPPEMDSLASPSTCRKVRGGIESTEIVLLLHRIDGGEIVPLEAHMIRM
jgi:hypothetical protein